MTYFVFVGPVTGRVWPTDWCDRGMAVPGLGSFAAEERLCGLSPSYMRQRKTDAFRTVNRSTVTPQQWIGHVRPLPKQRAAA